MAGPKIFDVVQDTTTTTGTGTITLDNSAPSGFRTFGSVLSTGDTTLYSIRHTTLNEWEVGLGTYTSSGTTLARTTVLASSNSNAAVNFSAGTKNCGIVWSADFPSQFLHPTNTVANLAAFQAGRLLFPSNGFSLYRDSGSALVPWGPSFTFTEPIDSDYAWINQGSSTVTTTNGGIYLYAPATSASVRIRKKSKTGSYSCIMGFLPNLIGASAPRCGFVWRQSSDGKLVTFFFENNNVSAGYGLVSVYKWTSPTVFSASYISPAYRICAPIVWLKIQDNGTSRICSVSADGQNWLTVHTVGRTDFMTADEIGFGIDCGQVTYDTGMTVLSWREF